MGSAIEQPLIQFNSRKKYVGQKKRLIPYFQAPGIKIVTQILERTLAQHLRLKEDIKSVIIPVYFSVYFAVYHNSIHSSYIEVNLLNSLRHNKPSLREQDSFDSGLRRLGKFSSKSGFRKRNGAFFLPQQKNGDSSNCGIYSALFMFLLCVDPNRTSIQIQLSDKLILQLREFFI